MKKEKSKRHSRVNVEEAAKKNEILKKIYEHFNCASHSTELLAVHVRNYKRL